MGKFILPEKTKLVTALNPAADTAARSGGYVTLKDAARCYVVINLTQGSATPVDFTIKQAQDVEGTGAKAITNPVPIWANLDVSLSDTLIRQTDGVDFSTDAGIKNKVVVFQIDARSLDTNNDYDCVSVSTSDVDSTTFTSAMYILTDLRFQQATPPSAIVD